MVAVVGFSTNLPDYQRLLSEYDKVSTAEQNCLRRKIMTRAAVEVRKEARRVTKGVSTAKLNEIIRLDVDAQNRTAGGRFASGRGRLFINRTSASRTSQVLTLMVTGGSARVPSDAMRSSVIRLNGTRRSVRILKRIYRKTRTTGKRLDSNGSTVWYGINNRGTNTNYTVMKVRNGHLLFERRGRYVPATRKTGTTGGNRPDSKPIAYFPERVTYKPGQFDFFGAITRSINVNFRKDADQCFRDNTTKHFRRRDSRGRFVRRN